MSSVWGHLEWHIESANQFWAELEDILHLPKRPTLEQLDNSLLTYIKFCAEFHDAYLLNQRDLNHALGTVLHSVLFKFHSTRMIDLLLTEVGTNDSPSCIFMIYSLLLEFGHRSPALYRDLPRWRKVFGDLIAVLHRDCEDRPHEAIQDTPMASRIRLPSALLLYEVCRVQKLSSEDLELFTGEFIDHLFELVERTRLLYDEALNYALIKLLVALNEQFMVATLAPAAEHAPLPTPAIDPADTGSFPLTAPSQSQDQTTDNSLHPHHHKKDSKGNAITDASEAKRANRVLAVLMRRLGGSKTFGENMIFMLNRAENTPEDLCMQLLILKILYLLFTTPGTKEYFYTNDLKVLVDVFIRELSDLPEESEALRHTYLRVLHPLLTNTQLRALPTPYKRPNLLRVLDAQIANPYGLREIGPTTKRLVDRCLSGSWCGREREKQMKEEEERKGNGKGKSSGLGVETMTSLAETLGVEAQIEGQDNDVISSPSHSPSRASSSHLQTGSGSSASSLHKSISRLSVESSSSNGHHRLVAGSVNGSSLSLNSVAGATAPSRARVMSSSGRKEEIGGGSDNEGLDDLKEGVRLEVRAGDGGGSDNESIDSRTTSTGGGGRHHAHLHPRNHQVHQHDAFRSSHSPLQAHLHSQHNSHHRSSSSPSSSSFSSSTTDQPPLSITTSYHSHLTTSPKPASPTSLPPPSPPLRPSSALSNASSITKTRRKPPPPPVDRSTKHPHPHHHAQPGGADLRDGGAGGRGPPPVVDRSTKGVRRGTPPVPRLGDGDVEVRIEVVSGGRGGDDRGVWETFG